MGEIQLLLSPQERDELVRLLETALGDTRVELHHTDFSPDYKDKVKEEEGLIRSLLNKLRPVPAK
jgi:hypothetical protein